MVRTAIHNSVKGTRVPRARLIRLSEMILGGRRREREVNLIFVTDARMKQLNRKFRGRDKTTDVLSFNLEEDGDPLIGEVYISTPQARRNAREYGISSSAEILRLFAHGLLHLRGIHHPDEKATARMNRMLEGYLKKLENVRAK